MKYDNLIIDGNNLLYRSFFSKRPAKFVNDFDTKPLFQVLLGIKNLVREYEPNRIFFTVDKRHNENAVNQRRLLISSYKENRSFSEQTEKILSYMPIVLDFCKALGITVMYPFSLEADDVICYLTKINKGTNLIVSSDRDLFQLINENTHQLIPTRNIVVDLDNFEEYANVPPDIFIFYKAVLGDASDNISGLEKYGEVRSKVLAQRLKDETFSILNDHQRHIVENNIQIMDLTRLVFEDSDEISFYEQQLNNQKDKEYDSEVFLKLLQKYEFKIFIKEIGLWTKMFQKDSNFSLDNILETIEM